MNIQKVKDGTTPTQYKYMILWYDDMSFAEIGRRYGVTRQTVYKAIRRGVANTIEFKQRNTL